MFLVLFYCYIFKNRGLQKSDTVRSFKTLRFWGENQKNCTFSRDFYKLFFLLSYKQQDLSSRECQRERPRKENQNICILIRLF